MSVFILSQVMSMTTQVEWMVSKDGLIPLSCLAGNTLAIAVYIRLIRSSGLTLFSLCLLVLHEHFDISINRSSYSHSNETSKKKRL